MPVHESQLLSNTRDPTSNMMLSEQRSPTLVEGGCRERKHGCKNTLKNFLNGPCSEGKAALVSGPVVFFNASSSVTNVTASPDQDAINHVSQDLPSAVIQCLDNKQQVQLYSALTLPFAATNGKNGRNHWLHSQQRPLKTDTSSLCRPWLTPTDLDGKEKSKESEIRQQLEKTSGTNGFHSNQQRLHEFTEPNPGDMHHLHTNTLTTVPTLNQNTFHRRTQSTSDIPTTSAISDNFSEVSHSVEQGHVTANNLEDKRDKKAKKKKKKHKHKNKKRSRSEGVLHQDMQGVVRGVVCLVPNTTTSSSPEGDTSNPHSGGNLISSRSPLTTATSRVQHSVLTGPINHAKKLEAPGEYFHAQSTSGAQLTNEKETSASPRNVTKNSSNIPREHLPPRKRHMRYLEAVADKLDNPVVNQPFCEHISNLPNQIPKDPLSSTSSEQHVNGEEREILGVSTRGLNGLALLAMECARQQSALSITSNSQSPPTVNLNLKPEQDHGIKKGTFVANDEKQYINEIGERKSQVLPTDTASNKEDTAINSPGKGTLSGPTTLGLHVDTVQEAVNWFQEPIPRTLSGQGVTIKRPGSAFVHVQQSKKARVSNENISLDFQIDNGENVDVQHSDLVQQSKSRGSSPLLPPISYISRQSPASPESNMTNMSADSADRLRVGLPLSSPSPIFTFSNISQTSQKNGYNLPSTVHMSSTLSVTGLRPFPPPGPLNSSSPVSGIMQFSNGLSSSSGNHQPSFLPLNRLPFTGHPHPQSVLTASLDTRIPYPQPLPIVNSVVTTRPSPTSKDNLMGIRQQTAPTSVTTPTPPSDYNGFADHKLTIGVQMTDTTNAQSSIPFALNGLTRLATPTNLPCRPSPIRPLVNPAMGQFGPSLSPQINCSISPSNEQITPGPLSERSAGPEYIPNRLELSTDSNLTHMPGFDTMIQPRDLRHATTTQLPFSNIQQSTVPMFSTQSPEKSTVPNISQCTSVLPTTSAYILPLPATTSSVPISATLNNEPCSNLPSTQSCQIPLPQMPRDVMPLDQMNQFPLSTIDSSQIALPNGLNGYPYPLNGTVRDVIGNAAQYAPLKRAPGRTRLANHISAGVPIGDSSFLCDVCNKVFPLQRLLKRHMKCHNTVKRYHCAHCSKGFNDTFDLKRHVRTHTGVRPYKCAECHKAFTQRCSLESHLIKVHGKGSEYTYKERRSKIFVCEECGHTTKIADQHYNHIKDKHPDSNELRKYQDKMQLQRLVLDNSSCGNSATTSSEGSSPIMACMTRSPEQESNDSFPSSSSSSCSNGDKTG